MALTRPEIKKLDKIWADTVKALANYRCEHCGLMGGRVEAAHVVGRRHRTTRWGLFDELGEYDLCGHCLCHQCHQHYDEHGPLEQRIIETTVGLERKEALQFLARTSVAKDQDFENIKTILESLDPGPTALGTTSTKK